MYSVSSVITNFNGGDCIINCIRALYRQEVPLEAIIVVDSGSTDGSPDRIRATFPDVQLVELSEDRGLPKARNIGLQLCKTDLILLLDDDVYVAEDCLRHMLEVYSQEKPAVICPRIILFPELEVVQTDGAEAHFLGTMALRHGYRPVKDVPAETTTVGGCIGACYFVHRERVLKAGGFDEAYFFYFEDLEFSIRLRAFGHKFICVPAAIVYHDRGSGTPGLSFRGQGKYPSRKAFLTLRNRLMTILIHYRVRTLAVLMPALAFYEFASLVLVLFRNWGAEWARAWLWQIFNIRAILKRRKWVQKMRKLNDRDLLVGGSPPLVPGLLNSRIAIAAFTTLSKLIDAYWYIAQNWLG